MKFIGTALLVVALFAGRAQAQAPASLSSTTCPGAGCQNFIVEGMGTAGIQISGTFVGTLQFEQLIDTTTGGVAWATWTLSPNGGGADVTSATGPGVWFASVAGARQVRVRFSAYTSGTAVVAVYAATVSFRSKSPTFTLAIGNAFCLDTVNRDLYLARVGVNDLGIFTNATNCGSGTQRFDVSATAVTSAVPLILPIGLVSATTLNFGSNAGFYSPGTNRIGIASTGNTENFEFDIANGRLVFAATNAISWGSIGLSSQDIFLYRPASKTIRLDADNAGLALTLVDVRGPLTASGALATATKIQPGSFAFAAIATTLTANGDMAYCSDCTIANPCAGGGTGAFAKRLNGVNVCN